MTIKEELFALQDISYADFQAKLTPNIPRELFVGVRVPEARKLAKRLAKKAEASEFLKDLPHTYYDENILHSLLLSEMKDYDVCIVAVDTFLPYVDNWAVCDIMSPKIFKKNKPALLEKKKSGRHRKRPIRAVLALRCSCLTFLMMTLRLSIWKYPFLYIVKSIMSR